MCGTVNRKAAVRVIKICPAIKVHDSETTFINILVLQLFENASKMTGLIYLTMTTKQHLNDR